MTAPPAPATLGRLEHYAERRPYVAPFMPELRDLPDTAFVQASPENMIYATADAVELLGTYAGPRVDLADALYAEADTLLSVWNRDPELRPRVAAALIGGQRRLLAEYLALRRRLVPDNAAHTTMTEAQRAALLLFFLAVLRVNYVVHAWRASEDGDLPGLQFEAAEFDYVARVAAIAAAAGAGTTTQTGPLRLAVRPGPLERYDLATWYDALQLLLKAMHVVGYGASGWDARAYWDALWDRFTQLASLRPAPGDVECAPDDATLAADDADANADAAPPAAMAALLASLGLQEGGRRGGGAAPDRRASDSLLDHAWGSEPSGLRHDERTQRLGLALPIVHGGRRLRVHFLHTAESVYHTHVLRMQALDAFDAASRAPACVVARDMLVARMPEGGAGAATTLLRFLDEIASDESDTVQRVMRESVWRRHGAAHLMPGEAELFVLRGVNEAARTDGMGAAVAVHVRPHADEVLAALRIDDFARMTRLTEGDSPAERVATDYLQPVAAAAAAAQAAAQAVPAGAPAGVAAQAAPGGVVTRPAPPAERLGVLLIAAAVDVSMSMLSAPGRVRFMAATYLDELRNEGDGVRANAPPPTPRDAFASVGQVTRCALVRLARRHFIVLSAPGGAAGQLLTLELPSFAHAVLAWLAVADTNPSPASGGGNREPLCFVHASLRPVVRAMRSPTGPPAPAPRLC